MSAPLGSKNRQMEGMLEGPIPDITEEQITRMRGHIAYFASDEDEKAMFGGMILGDDYAIPA